jgi:hypothetical protein
MRVVPATLVVLVLAASAATVDATPADAFCSVFNRRPCMPSGCSVYQRRPCLPQYEFWIGQDLRLTVESGAASGQATAPAADIPDHQLHSLRDMFAALRGCWVPPPQDEAKPGMQMSVRFAFKRNGEIIAEPRVTYTTPDATTETRERYRKAIAAALERCTPLPFSDGLAGAVAGRPIAIRFVDNRTLEQQKEQP